MEINKEKIQIEDFSKIDIRLGKILSAEAVENSDKLVKFQVDLGPLDTARGEEKRDIRQILSGIRDRYSDWQNLVGKFVPVVVNLAPRTIRGLESSGMILYAVAEDNFAALHPDREISSGTKIS